MVTTSDWPEPRLRAWLLLAHTPGLGRAAGRRLLAAHDGDAQAALAAGAAAWHGLLTAPALAALHQANAEQAESAAARAALLARTRRWLDADGDAERAARRWLIAWGDADYPQPLAQTADPPLLLYLEGDPEALRRPAVAIVGSRRPTPQGGEHAHTFAAALAATGWAVVSGLALGVDAAAHRGALAMPGGVTIAVLGHGLDSIYPAAHRGLASAIASGGGLLLSEFGIGEPALPTHFPQRNRLIAGLALGTVVVEAALRSGSLITARLAAEAGRLVFALPGALAAAQSQGCHQLIRQGATLVTSPAEVLEDLASQLPAAAAHTGARAPAAPPLGEASPKAHPTATPTATPTPEATAANDADGLLAALGHAPSSLDELVARTGWPTPRLLARLLEWELQGQVARLPGGLYQRQGRG